MTAVLRQKRGLLVGCRPIPLTGLGLTGRRILISSLAESLGLASLVETQNLTSLTGLFLTRAWSQNQALIRPLDH